MPILNPLPYPCVVERKLTLKTETDEKINTGTISHCGLIVRLRCAGYVDFPLRWIIIVIPSIHLKNNYCK